MYLLFERYTKTTIAKNVIYISYVNRRRKNVLFQRVAVDAITSPAPRRTPRSQSMIPLRGLEEAGCAKVPQPGSMSPQTKMASLFRRLQFLLGFFTNPAAFKPFTANDAHALPNSGE